MIVCHTQSLKTRYNELMHNTSLDEIEDTCCVNIIYLVNIIYS